MHDDFFDFEEHPENFYIVDEMVNGDDTSTSTGSCCSVLLIVAILTIILTVA
ncbi:MAG: hypothetical protein MJ203_01295 [archaeon]|nr:hypothetical protein [archaeon]